MSFECVHYQYLPKISNLTSLELTHNFPLATPDAWKREAEENRKRQKLKDDWVGAQERLKSTLPS